MFKKRYRRPSADVKKRYRCPKVTGPSAVPLLKCCVLSLQHCKHSHHSNSTVIPPLKGANHETVTF